LLPSPPNTEVWIALYVQVHQADKATMRNIELDKRRGQVSWQHDFQTRTREQMAEVRWSDATLDSLLHACGLDPHSPLSVLAVELLPEPNGGFVDPLGGRCEHHLYRQCRRFAAERAQKFSLPPRQASMSNSKACAEAHRNLRVNFKVAPKLTRAFASTSKVRSEAQASLHDDSKVRAEARPSLHVDFQSPFRSSTEPLHRLPKSALGLTQASTPPSKVRSEAHPRHPRNFSVGRS
jgi:hypothetical protein